MFSGIIERKALIKSHESLSGGVRISTQFLGDGEFTPSIGESIALNGVCLTVETWDAETRTGTFFISDESLNRTHFKNLKSGDVLNVERSLRMGDRLSGHWVQGHVDGVARLVSIEKQGEAIDLFFELPVELSKYTIEKGSITIQGISLTINSIQNQKVSVRIIPHTWEVTCLSQLNIGDFVNIEVDLLAKYAEKFSKGGNT